MASDKNLFYVIMALSKANRTESSTLNKNPTELQNYFLSVNPKHVLKVLGKNKLSQSQYSHGKY